MKRFSGIDIENGNSQKFKQVDDFHAIGEDGCKYQILPIEEVIDCENNFIGDFLPILLFLDKENGVALNYAED